jgi:predicted secreted protein
MAFQDSAPGEELVFQFGDGGGPETFAAACSINTDRKLDLSSELSDAVLTDCVTPSAPGRHKRRVKSTDLKFTGAGIADIPSFNTLVELWQEGQPFNGKVIQDHSGGKTITGKWLIESMSIGGTKGEEQTFDISLAIADPDYTIA